MLSNGKSSWNDEMSSFRRWGRQRVSYQKYKKAETRTSRPNRNVDAYLQALADMPLLTCQTLVPFDLFSEITIPYQQRRVGSGVR